MNGVSSAPGRRSRDTSVHGRRRRWGTAGSVRITGHDPDARRDFPRQAGGPAAHTAFRAVTLAPMSDGSVDAFGVNGSALRVYTLAQGSNTWVKSQSMEVPIAYGSSS